MKREHTKPREKCPLIQRGDDHRLREGHQRQDLCRLIHAAQLGLIRPEEFRKNAVKFGWELWEDKAAKNTRSNTEVKDSGN
ncbi:TPA: hypothetical protein HA274_02790, partial [Candidatus Bathyarchaeota archaeon]|nr:hypothetical protein [Candidatus Bathyarchaeota archaeon]